MSDTKVPDCILKLAALYPRQLSDAGQLIHAENYSRKAMRNRAWDNAYLRAVHAVVSLKVAEGRTSMLDSDNDQIVIPMTKDETSMIHWFYTLGGLPRHGASKASSKL